MTTEQILTETAQHLRNQIAKLAQSNAPAEAIQMYSIALKGVEDLPVALQTMQSQKAMLGSANRTMQTATLNGLLDLGG